jgi:multimeric flavodoxin WrbA
MQVVEILGISDSPRKGANTAILVKKALEGAASVLGVKTEFYEMAGKKLHHCMGCLECSERGVCVFKDDLQDFIKRWMEADGIIWGAPVYLTYGGAGLDESSYG